MPATLPKIPDGIPGRHLGRKSPPAHMRRGILPLAPFIKRMGAKPPPDVVDYTLKGKATLSTMLGNDQVGDCTIAAVLHQGGVMTAEQPGGHERVPTTQEAMTQYPQICGRGDQGCYVPEVMNHWRDAGMMIGGKSVKADGYVSLHLGDDLLHKIALYLFGPLHFGVNLPNDWYQNANAGFVWDVTSSRIVGGHSIAIPGYTTDTFRVSTWGQVGHMTLAAFRSPSYIEESYAVLSPDWYDKDGLDEHGVNVQALKDALEAIRSGGTPDIPDGPTPPTPPTPPAGGSTLTADGAMDFLGTKMPIHLTGILDAPANARGMASWLTLLGDVAAIVVAGKAGDWAGVAVAVDKLLADLGVSLGQQERESFTRALLARYASVTTPEQSAKKQ